MIPVPWSASQGEDDSSQNSSADDSSGSCSSSSTPPSSPFGKAPTDDMSVYLQHFLSVHSRVHNKRRQPLARQLPRHTSTDTVRTEPTAACYIAASHRIVPPPSTATSPHQNLIQTKSPLANGSSAVSNSRLPRLPAASSHVPDSAERVRAHTIGRSVLQQPPPARRLWDDACELKESRIGTAPPGASPRKREPTNAPEDGRAASSARSLVNATRVRAAVERAQSVATTKPLLRQSSPTQPLLVTNSSSSAGTSGFHAPRPKKMPELLIQNSSSSMQSGALDSSVGMRRKAIGAKAAQLTGESFESVLESAKSAAPAKIAAALRPVETRPNVAPSPTISAAGRLVPSRAGSMSHSLIDRRRRLVQPTVQMELIAPDRLRRSIRSSLGERAGNGHETVVGTIVEAELPTHRSMNPSSRRLIGSITTTAATPLANFRFQQVGSTMGPAPPQAPASELLRRVVKEVGTESVLDGDQLELLLTTGRYSRVRELMNLGLRREELTRNVYRINAGTFCSVYLGRWEGRDVAVKCPHTKLLDTDPLMMTHRAIAEWKILSQIDHPHIIKLIGGIVLEEERTIWLVTEYVHSGDVYNFLYNRRGDQAALVPGIQGYRRFKLMEQLAEGLSYLHARRVVHKDIKCNNLLITSKDVLKICDFGDAEVLAGVHIQCCTAATWQYVSPELVCSSDPSRPAGATELVDVWAMGCVFLEMIKCQTPFFHLLENVPECSQRDRLRHFYLSGSLEAEIRVPCALPPKLRSLVSRCLQFHAAKRNSSHQILHYMRVNSQQLQTEIELWLQQRQPPLMRPLSPVVRPPAAHVRASANPMYHATSGGSKHPATLWPLVRGSPFSPRLTLFQHQPLFMSEKQF